MESWISSELWGLNPFEFRAGIQSHLAKWTAAVADVLIPLNSGQVFSHNLQVILNYFLVLIPLNSGQVFSRRCIEPSMEDAVLIPLNSGQVFSPRHH